MHRLQIGNVHLQLHLLLVVLDSLVELLLLGAEVFRMRSRQRALDLDGLLVVRTDDHAVKACPHALVVGDVKAALAQPDLVVVGEPVGGLRFADDAVDHGLVLVVVFVVIRAAGGDFRCKAV